MAVSVAVGVFSATAGAADDSGAAAVTGGVDVSLHPHNPIVVSRTTSITGFIIGSVKKYAAIGL
jgi:hypothetical protein